MIAHCLRGLITFDLIIMLKNLTLNSLKILHSGQIPGRFITAQILESPDKIHQEMGKIYVLLEILQATSIHRQIGQTILNTLKRAYYSGESTSDLQNFEQALKSVNETLAHISQNGETSWIGNLNAIFCLSIQNQVHLATSGKIKTWLIRNDKISEIVDSKIQIIGPHPLKTFSNITSGSIDANDLLIFANSQALNHLSSQIVKQFFANQNFIEAGENIFTFFKKTRDKAIAFFTLNVEIPVENQAVQDIQLTVDKQSASALSQAIKFSKKYILPWVKKTGQNTHQYLKASINKTKTRYLPQSKKFLKTASDRSRQLSREYFQKAKPIIQKTGGGAKKFIGDNLVKIKKDGAEIASTKNDSFIGRSIYTINDYRNEHTSSAKKIVRTANQTIKKVIIKIDNAWYFFRKNYSSSKKRPLMIVICAVTLIFVLIVSISVQRKKQAQKLASQQKSETLSQAQKKLDEGKSALILSDKQTATELFENAINLAQKIQNSEYKTEAEKIISQASNQADSITQTKRYFNLTPFATDLKGEKMFTFQGSAFLLENEKIIKINILSGKKQEIPSIAGKWQDLIKFDDRHFYLLTQAGEIYNFNAEDERLIALNLPQNKTGALIDFDIFADNIYAFSAKDAKIWKFNKNENNYQDPVSYTGSALANQMSKAVALTIDNSIYALLPNKVLKISKGAATDFRLKNLPKTFDDLSNPIDIYTAESISSLYILDQTKARVLEFDKDGNYLKQYLFPPAIKKPTCFQVDHKGKKVWILADGNGYEVDL
ncbi:MAG: Uncharacterized protein CEN89_190 [Candidatus Berkelbacteria bacterium Licking1014_7]|uniref:Uncharacterized protein n=1 Tax=Candidatus Berkelbacteria bacterium Licking1014_7 TaxID=2017147 RepID=A0A554LJY9_9BACT|nr:MAG: Uncharacterized protein CEN89_190 [Candidatus Berkelbacteria bacterium Licking1014_7]